MRRKVIKWIFGKLLQNYHLSRNPPKGIKKPRRLLKESAIDCTHSKTQEDDRSSSRPG